MRLDDFAQRAAISSTLTTPELMEYVHDVKTRGADVSLLELEKHSRTSTPFAIFVLTFIGVGIASRKVRGGIGVHLFIAVLVGFTFVFTSRMITVYASTAALPDFVPISDASALFIAAWLPNLIYTALGIAIYAKAPK
jgi:lipopolysaccharide export system permease protein